MRGNRTIPAGCRAIRAARHILGAAWLVFGLAVTSFAYPDSKAGSVASEPDEEQPTFIVVVAPDNPVVSVTLAELQRIFLRKTTRWDDGEAITVYQRSVEDPIRAVFSQRVLGKESAELNEYWMNLALTRGIKPPKVLRSATLVKQYLKRVRGGIGYILADEVDDTVKVLTIKKEDDRRVGPE